MDQLVLHTANIAITPDFIRIKTIVGNYPYNVGYAPLE